MSFKHLIAAVAAATLSISAFAGSHEHHDAHPHWGYEGAGAPEHWGELDPGYAACGTGKRQSPVDLTGSTDVELPPIVFDYKAGGEQVINNGHTIQVNFAEGSRITVDGHAFALKQFHAHAPSENRINGKSFPMELHFVHADKDGKLAVVAVMVEEGTVSAELDKAWKVMPAGADGKAAPQAALLGTALMPEDKAYYRFSGSLTTPPCTEGVTWLVLKKTITASKAQISRFAHVMHHPNNRPVQPANGREILE